ncbi:MAG: glycoside hydrolase family 16 protein [Muribaculaceae bacterium]|nr:glycoside hydrolase family 16 protein [Muribaculaceae bacterium]
MISATGSPYELNYPETQLINSNNNRSTGAISLSGQAGTQTLEVPQATDRLLYHKVFTNPFVVTPGETVSASISFAGTWMNAYVYVDYNNDGEFDPETEAVSYSNYQGENSAGETNSSSNTMALPQFMIPEDIAPGVYRIRYKVDWNSLDPGGSTVADNHIIRNEGSITDAILMVCGNNDVALGINAEEGRLVQPDRQALPSSVPALSSIIFKGLPDMGQHLESIRIEYGYPDAEVKFDNVSTFTHTVDGAEIFRNEGVIPSYTVLGEGIVLTPSFADGDFVDPIEKDGYRLVWSDEFNQPDGTSADMVDNWQTPSRMDATWRRYVTDRDDLREIHNGRVVLAAKVNDGADPEITSEWVTGALESATKFNYTYGYTEARLMCHYVAGTFPAYWMMPEDQSAGWPYCGEIDIWEAADGPTRSWHTIHGPWNPNGGSISSGALPIDYSRPIVYGFEWTPDYLEWFIDGESVYKVEKTHNRIGDANWVFDKPYFIRINQSIGDGSWAGKGNPAVVYKTEFDYVRVYQKEGQQNEGGKTYSIDYFDKDNIPTAGADAENDGKVTYTDLQGRTVRQPQHAGVYIEHRNNRFKKVILK